MGENPVTISIMLTQDVQLLDRTRTILSVLGQREDTYRHLLEFSGSESEREAHRRNRIIQMKLEVSLAEISLQRRSSVQLLKIEEVRFLQKVRLRSNKLRSAAMLEQLRLFSESKFSSTVVTPCFVSPPREHIYHLNPLTRPFSSRADKLLVCHGFLDRPKTSLGPVTLTIHDKEMEGPEPVHGQGQLSWENRHGKSQSQRQGKYGYSRSRELTLDMKY